jgi:hypothetical protein
VRTPTLIVPPSPSGGPWPAVTGTVRRLHAGDLAACAIPEAPAISPDGSTITYVLRTVDVEEDR